jgi:ubiquinone biosynthesis protein COQ9
MKIIRFKEKILKDAMPFIIKNGWNDNLFKSIEGKSKNKTAQLQVLFPNGYMDLMQTYLNSLNDRMTKKSNKFDFFRLKIHLRIRKIFIIRLKLMLLEKKIVTKTFIHLILPYNYKFALKNLYNTVDQMWYLAGDNSTDFNFYSKRAILGSIYSSTIHHFINNDDIDETIRFLDLQLKQVSKIPKIKNNIGNLIKLAPKLAKLKKAFP